MSSLLTMRPRPPPNIVALATTVLFADASAISRTSAQIDDVPSAMTQDMSLATVLSPRTPARGLSSTRGTLRDCDLILEVRVFKGGIVMVQGPNLLFSIIHLAPLMTDSPLTFTFTTSFFTNIYRYTVR